MIVEIFDIETFCKNDMTQTSVFDETKGEWQNRLIHSGYFEEILSDSTIIIQTEENYTNGEKEYTESIIPHNSIFCTYRVFYSDGSLKIKFTKSDLLGTVSFIPDGKEYYYDKKGVLIKEVDNEKLYSDVKVTPDVLFSLLSRHNIYNLEDRPKGILYVWFNSPVSMENENARIPYKNGDNPFWEITKIYEDKGNGSFEKTYKVNAITGEITEIN